MITEDKSVRCANETIGEDIPLKDFDSTNRDEPKCSLRAIGAQFESRVAIGDYLTLGAEPSNKIQILGEGIATHHARIELRAQDYFFAIKGQRQEPSSTKSESLNVF